MLGAKASWTSTQYDSVATLTFISDVFDVRSQS